jgi:hypothetical protein
MVYSRSIGGVMYAGSGGDRTGANMRVIIQVSSGPAAGKRFLLGAGQTVKVGRTEWADHSFPEDGRMSSTHFALETDATACYVHDLGSTNGTFVGGRRIAEKAALRHGDEILAGQTRFQVQLEGMQGEGMPGEGAFPQGVPLPGMEGPADAMGPAFPMAAPPVAPFPDFPQPVAASFTVEKCDSGLTLCRGTGDQILPADLAVLLCQTCPAYLIVDFRNLGSPPPEDLAARNYLFDWLPPPSAEIISPLLIGQDDLLTWPMLIAQGWGKDAVICLFSRQEKPALLEHLHRSLRAKPQREDMSGGMLGYCWPSVMSMLLGHSPPSMIRPLLAGIDAVLVELPDLPETWQLYGEAGVAQLLVQAGLTQKSAEHAHA